MAPFRQKRIPAHLKPENQPVLGRPSEYKPEYDQLVIDKMSKGFSLTAFAGFVTISPDTVYDWITRYPTFAHAVGRARGARVHWLEDKLLRSRKGAETSAAIFALKNACPTEWRDVKHSEQIHLHAVRQMTDAELLSIASQSAGVVIEGDSERVDPPKLGD